MRQWGNVFDGLDRETSRLQRGDRTFTTTARALHADLNFLDSKLRRFLRTLLRGTLARERRALSATLEPRGSGTAPAQGVTLGVSDGNRRIIERRLNIGDAGGYVSPNFTTS